MGDTPIYRDTSAGIDDRVEDLIDRMTIEEKVAQLGGCWITSLVSGDAIDEDRVARRLRHGIGQVTRIGASTGLRPAGSAALMNELQRRVVDGTRLAIPLLVHEESTGGYCGRDATVFPQALALACSWEPALLQDVASVIREQLLGVGARQTLAPVLDVARDARWGRVEETYGEDPVLIGTLGAAYVRGLQTDDLAGGVVATAKHFLGYGLSEGGMNHAPVQLGPRELREVFAEPFAAAIRDAGLASVMNSYSSVDGLPCAGSAAILTDLLRDELGFDGTVVADYFAVSLLESHHRTAGSKAEAAVQALTAGLDVELPALDCFPALVDEVAAGRVSVEVVDEAVRRVVRQKIQLGLFEQPYVDVDSAPAVFDTDGQRTLARRAAAAGVVILTNRDDVLPFDPATVGTVAVVGPGADDERLLQGDYHYPAHVEIVFSGDATAAAAVAGLGATEPGRSYLPESGGAFAAGPYFTPHVTPRAALVELLGEGRVRYAVGCAVSGDDSSGIDGAVAAAQDADLTVVVVAGKSGLTTDATVGEARDAVDLDLTGVQPDLVAAVAGTGTPTVVVVLSGRVHTLGAQAEQASALVQAFPLGEEGGHGLVDVLSGAVPPAGRLPVSLPRHVGQVPIHAGHRAGGGTAMFYSAYSDSETTPLFPFGHGLALTTFERRLAGVVAGDTASDPTTVTVEVTNTGERAGVDVVQPVSYTHLTLPTTERV